MASKRSRYYKLVNGVKNCSKCIDSPTGKGVHLVQDLNRSEINLWSHWQGSLDASFLVIGQDWEELPVSSTYKFWTTDKTYPSLTCEHEQIQKNKFKTDNNLATIIYEALSLDLSKKQHSLLFTNAILCYRDKGFTGDVKQSWFENCQKFCTRLIDIIQLEAIVSLGYMPLKALLYRGGLSYDKDFSKTDMRLRLSKPMRETVETKDQLYYQPKGSEKALNVIPLFHCGSWGTKTRPLETQIKGWTKIKESISEKKQVSSNIGGKQ